MMVAGASGFSGYRCLPCLVVAEFEVHKVTLRHGVAFTDTRISWHRYDLLNQASYA